MKKYLKPPPRPGISIFFVIRQQKGYYVTFIELRLTPNSHTVGTKVINSPTEETGGKVVQPPNVLTRHTQTHHK